LPCVFKQFYGLDCPGCGLQRSFILLLQGEFVSSFKMYPPLIPTVITFFVFYLDKIFDLISNKRIFNNTGLVLLVMIFANFLIKIVIKIM